MRLKIIFSVLLFFICITSKAEVKLPALISDGMVLQRDVPLNIWGFASPNEAVEVIFKSKTYQTVTSANGKWLVKLPAYPSGGPFQMQIKGSNQINVKDILIGDVWLCSGQSNMAFKMEAASEKYATEILQAKNPYIRQINVAEKYSFSKPLNDFKSDGWKSADPKSVLKFTAVGYFFAVELNKTKKVPVGLILSSWGGTPAEAWMSNEALTAFPKYSKIAEKLKDSSYLNAIKYKESKEKEKWYQVTKNEDIGFKSSPFFLENVLKSDWQNITLPNFFEPKTGDIDGVVWFAKEITLSESLAQKDAILHLGNLMDQDTTYVNGIKVGTSANRYVNRLYKIPSNLLKAGKNTIVVRLLNRTGPGGFIKDKRYELQFDSEKVSLVGQWQYKIGVVTKPQPTETVFAYQPLGLFNAMLNPLLDYKIKGVLWYQGESNTGKAQEYKALFPALIKDWRKHFDQGNLPFLYVQLANYMQTKELPAESKWAELREAQMLTLKLTNTAMAVATDLGEWNDVHPLNKADVGNRLFLGAEKIAYNKTQIVHSGPIYSSHQVYGNKIVVQFNHIGSGLIARNGTLKYFSVAGLDNKFVWAKAKIEGDKVIV